jgi:hypothetical protein
MPCPSPHLLLGRDGGAPWMMGFMANWFLAMSPMGLSELVNMSTTVLCGCLSHWRWSPMPCHSPHLHYLIPHCFDYPQSRGAQEEGGRQEPTRELCLHAYIFRLSWVSISFIHSFIFHLSWVYFVYPEYPFHFVYPPFYISCTNPKACDVRWCCAVALVVGPPHICSLVRMIPGGLECGVSTRCSPKEQL